MGKNKDIIIAELCGAIAGDGWIQSNKSGFFIMGDPQEDREYYDIHLSKLFKQVVSEVKPRAFKHWNVYGIGIYKKKQINQIIKWGIPTGTKVYTVSIPDWIKKENKKIKEAFIRGIFDTDGGISCQKDYTKYAKNFDKNYHTKARIRISSVSKNLIDEIFSLLEKLDYRCTKRKRVPKQTPLRKNNTVYILEINSKESLHRFFKEIRPSNKRHTTKYLIWKRWGFCPAKTTLKQRVNILKNHLNPYNLY
jgi:intein/homing endonuclease